MALIKLDLKNYFSLSRYFISIFIIVLFFIPKCFAQNYAGTDFRVSFLKNIPTNYNYLPAFYFSGFALEDAHIEIAFSVPGNPLYDVVELDVLAGNPFLTSFDSIFYNQYSLNTKEFMSFHITSTGNIRLYATHYRMYFSEATAVLPTSELGNDYMAVSQKATIIQGLSTLKGESLCAIIGTEDNTIVSIIPSHDIPLGNAGETINISLDAGEVITIGSFLPSENAGENDLTGTRIFTPNNEKIAVFGGHVLTTISCSETNHLYEQLPPISHWGKDFPLVLAGGSPDLLRVVAAEDSTHIYLGCEYQATIHAGEYFETLISQPTILHTLKPTLPIMFTTGYDCSQMGDPNMRVVLPITAANNLVQFAQLIDFKPFIVSEQYYYVHLVSHADDALNVLLNGAPITNWIPFDDDLEMVYSNPLLDGPMVQHTVESATPFWAEFVALGPFDAVTMSLGANTEMEYNTFQPGYVFLGPDMRLCQGDTILITADYQGDFSWNDGSENPTRLITEMGTYTAISHGDCGISSDTLFVYPGIEPEFSWAEYVVSCGDNAVNLVPNGQTIYESYVWNTGDTLKSISVTHPGVYHVQIWSIDGCYAHDSINVIFQPFPEFSIIAPDSICDGDPQQIYVTESTGSIEWSTGESGTSITIDKGGIYSATIATEYGCKTAESIYITPVFEPIIFGEDTTLCVGNKLKYTPLVSNASVTWPGYSDNETIEISEGGIYLAVATNFCGNKELSLTVVDKFCDCLLDIPNVFTPNGDFKNDEFIPLFECNNSYYYLRIYNRWGHLIFTSQNPNIGWNGKIQDSKGEDASEGVYLYTLEYENSLLDNPEMVQRRGFVTLLR